MRCRTASIASFVLAGILSSSPATAGAQLSPDEFFDFNIDADTGYALIVERNYWHIDAEAAFRIWYFATMFDGPVNLDVETWDVRTEDWDEARDYMRIFPCTRFDWSDQGFLAAPGDCSEREPEDEEWMASARLAPIEDLSLGHGHILTGYSTFLDVDHYTLGVAGEFQLGRWAGGDLLLGDVTRPDLLGGRLFVRPVRAETERSLHELEIGLTAVADLGAPTEAVTALGGARLLDASGNLLFDTGELVAFGADLDYRMNVGGEHFLGARGDWGFLWDTGRPASRQTANQGGHLAVGYLWEPAQIPVTLDFYGEYRMLGSSYIPSYFDDYYAVQREQYALTPNQRTTVDPTLTKLGYLRTLEDQPATFEHSYAAILHVDVWRDCPDALLCNEGQWVRFLRFYAFIDQIVGRPNSGSLGFVALAPDIPLGGEMFLSLLGAYIRRGFNDGGDMFALDGTLLQFLARLDIWGGLYVLATYDHLWRLDPDTGYFEGVSSFLATFGFTEDLF
ncbi:MAG: hypothetical protein HY907_23065 [Deltaproteobacteria bacterium]|nr:hypothetical protein [Deltaproteobacteria bacterium]